LPRTAIAALSAGKPQSILVPRFVVHARRIVSAQPRCRNAMPCRSDRRAGQFLRPRVG
jgi:hypothetical protein